MKKILSIALISVFLFAQNSFAIVDMKQVKKDAKKEAKTLKKEGWVTSPGALPIERQLEDCYVKELEKDDMGFSQYFMGNSKPVGQNYDAAKLQGQTLARLDIASKIQNEITALITNSVANKQLENDQAASITQTVMKSKELISGKLAMTAVLLECYRKLPNGNYELMIRIAYPKAKAMELARQALREQLEQESDELARALDNVK